MFTNHGSYGTVPREVMERRVELLHKMEAHPDRLGDKRLECCKVWHKDETATATQCIYETVAGVPES